MLQINNPCKKCLVGPMCQKGCKKNDEYIFLKPYVTLGMATSLMVLGLVLIMLVILLLNIQNNIMILIIAVLYCILLSVLVSWVIDQRSII